MANALQTPLRSSCFACLRRSLDVQVEPRFRSFAVQIRGKKKKVRSDTIPVKLVNDIIGYGPAGSIMRVKPGQMRNYWYPQGIAQYITGGDLLTVKRSPDLVTERDTFFGKEKPESDKEKRAPELVKIETKLLSSQRSQELLQNLLPDYLEFYRQPIPSSESKLQFPEREAPQRMAEARPEAIYGSVSTTDILNSVRELLKLKAAEEANKDAGRIVLEAEDIKLIKSEVDTGVEDDRIKFLGKFEFELQVKGGNSIRREVHVKAST